LHIWHELIHGNVQFEWCFPDDNLDFGGFHLYRFHIAAQVHDSPGMKYASDVPVLKKRRPLMARRLYLAWRLYIGLNYSWRLAWHKAAYQQAL